MVIDIAKLTKNWKTSAIGLLSLAIALIVAYEALPKGATESVIALALLRTAVGLLQKDAGESK